MLPEDCKTLVHFVQERDPIVVIRRDCKSSDIREEKSIWENGGAFVLWNQALLPSLQREYVPESKMGPYYTVSNSLPLLQLFVPLQSKWNGRPSLTQGRVYTGWSFEKGAGFKKWYNSIVYWIRKNYIRNPDRYIGGYAGPAAYKWFLEGGVLLPMLAPPTTPAWLAVIQSQDAVRKILQMEKQDEAKQALRRTKNRA